MTQDFVNSATEAQKKLHADMRRGSDPRWDLLPVVEKKERKPFPWKIVGWGLVGVIVGGMWWLA